MTKKTKILLYVFAVLFGIFFIIFGGYDDSPGAQMIGLVAVVTGVVGIVKSRKI